MAKRLDIYKLGVALDVDGAKGLSALKATDKELKAVDQNAKKAEGSLGKLAKGINRVTSVLRGNVSGAGGGGILPSLANISNIIQGIPQIGQLAHSLVSPLTEAAEEGVRFNMLIEGAEVGFKGVLGGAKEAGRYVKQLTDFAAANPIFNTQATVRAARQMNVFGFETQKTTGYLKIWGSALAAGGEFNEENLQGVVRGFGQMRQLQRVTAEDMNQLQDRGIPAYELLAKAIGKTVAETRKLSEQGKLNGAGAVDAITAMLDQDPRFAGQADAFAGTLEGMIAQAQDVREVASGRATQELTKSIKGIYAAALAGDNQQLIQTMAGGINATIKPIAGLIEGGAKAALSGDVKALFLDAYKAGMDAANPFKGLGFGAISSVAEGAKEAGSQVVTTVKGVADDAQQGLRDVWQQNSPSKLFYGLGFGAMRSLANGLQQGGQAVTHGRSGVGGALERWTEKQKENARRIVEIGHRIGATTKQIRAAISTGIVESNLRNLPHLGKRNDHDSLGIMQQRPSQGWGTAEQIQTLDYAIRKFYEVAMQMDRDDLSPGELAARVQRPAKKYRSRYAKRLPEADELYAAFSGDNEGSGATGGSNRPWAGMFGEHSRAMPVSVVNLAELAGVATRDLLEHGELPDLTKLTPLPKFPNYDEKGNITGYDSFDLNELTPLPKTPNYDAKGKLTGYDSSEPMNELPIGALKSFKDFLTIMPPLAAQLPVTAQKTNTALGNSEAAVGSFAKSVIMANRDLKGAFAQMASFMPQQQVGQKRGFFSKLLGFAAPFLGFIPGVGPLLSTLAGMGSAAAVGDWGSVLTQGVAGFSAGGVFRRSSTPSNTTRVGGVNLPNPGTATGTIATTGNTVNTNLSGARARGGPVRAGRAYLVGEHRAEVFTPEEDGFVHPSIDAFKRSQSSSGGGGGFSGGDKDGVWNQWREHFDRLAGAIEKFETMTPGEVLARGAKANPGAIGDGLRRAGTRDPKVVEWMNRRRA